ncbi:MAG: AAA family ATPase [Candidatus Eremiobacteraeota bacterium]|nr:AAA family ATPase [Candidatus Eremiobacteraeota bacterium]
MSDSIEPLLQALAHSPENVPLRAHVVREFLKARRYKELRALAEPLLDSEQRPVGLLAMARAEQASGRTEKAQQYYAEAIQADSSLIDEGLEAEFEPQESLKLTAGGEIVGLTPEEAIEKGQSITFDDIGGMEDLKEQLRLNIIYPMQKPEIYEAYGKKVGGGILLYGPPGCGKTHLARAVAGELGASFFSVGLNDILDMYIGVSERNLSDLFGMARSKAPSVLFIDEIDALGAKRGSSNSAHLKNMTTHFLTEMDGINSNNDKLLVLGATNEPWSVDSAFRRPGRFDRVIFVPPPDEMARAEILKIHSRGKNVDPTVPWDKLSSQMENFSGADIRQVVEQAVERAVADAIRSGDLRPVNHTDFKISLKARRPTTMEWLRRSRNYVNFANKDGYYDDLQAFLERAKIR